MKIEQSRIEEELLFPYERPRLTFWKIDSKQISQCLREVLICLKTNRVDTEKDAVIGFIKTIIIDKDKPTLESTNAHSVGSISSFSAKKVLKNSAQFHR